MRTSWLVGAVICFFIGLVLTFTVIGAIIGIPLIILSILLLLLGIILPGQKKEVQVHIHNHKK